MCRCQPSSSSESLSRFCSVSSNETQTSRSKESRGNESNTIARVLLNCLPSNLIWVFQLYIFFLLSTCTSAGIGCFVCSSFSKSNPECEDTFNSTVAHPSVGTVNNYQYPCWAFRQGRKGLFPADHCVKVSGYQLDNPSQTIVIRTCALDSGSLTADTEIVRISHCGSFRYQNKQYSGCVQSCSTDGCNAGTKAQSAGLVCLVSTVLLAARFLLSFS